MRKPPGTCIAWMFTPVGNLLVIHTLGHHHCTVGGGVHTFGESLYMVTMEVLIPLEKVLGIHTCNRSVVTDAYGEGGKAFPSTVIYMLKITVS